MVKNVKQAGIAFLLLMVMMISGLHGVAAVESVTLDKAVNDTAAYIYKTVQNPQIGSIGGEWAIIGLARSEYTVPQSYYDQYYKMVEQQVKACKGQLHDKKYTEYSRVVLALTAIGKDPADVAGYNLLMPLGDFDKTIWQGINGPIWALIALDSGQYEIPINATAKTQATRQMYIDEILARQLSDGGFSLFGGTADGAKDGVADPDITAMALQALAHYQDQEKVRLATDRALGCLSKMQNPSGGYESWGTSNSESCAQVLVALGELGIPLDDKRFVKQGQTVLDDLLGYYSPGNGFQHTANGAGSNQMATEQAFYGLVAASRQMNQHSSLYDMSDQSPTTTQATANSGLLGRNADIKVMPIVAPNKTFADLGDSSVAPYAKAIEALAGREIIAGKTQTQFDPLATMTRAEFATIIVQSLGLSPKYEAIFADVPATAWYAPYVDTAHAYGIVNGTAAQSFNPQGTITRQEAACMLANAAKICGLETNLDGATTRDLLAQFGDYTQSASWARTALAFCYQEGILSQEVSNILPLDKMKRFEIADMVYQMLKKAELL